MKAIIYRRADNSVALGMLSPKRIAVAMGSGGLKPTGAAFEREIASNLITDADSQAAFDADWEAFLAARRGTAREVIVRRLFTYYRDGGATEAEIYEAHGDKNMPSDCVDHRAVELSDLPTDTDFFDAWEWSD